MLLYEAYQAHSDGLTPIQLMARAAQDFLSQPWPLISDHPVVRGAAAACQLVSRAGMSHSRPDFGITETRVGNRLARITEEAAARHPFCTLLHFAKDIPVEQPR